MKRLFIVILIFLNFGSIAIAQVSQQEENDDVEYGVVNLTTSIKLSVNQNKIFDDFNLKNEISPCIICNENDDFVKQA